MQKILLEVQVRVGRALGVRECPGGSRPGGREGGTVRCEHHLCLDTVEDSG